MKTWSFAGLLAGCLLALPSAAEELPGVEDAIPAPVKALEAPASFEFPHGVHMAVTAASEKAQEHVNQGLNHLHGGWEFEASRHFAAAMREDPNCLLAHWGMVMTLLNPSPETGPARNAATDRLLALIEQGAGSELERGYAYGLIKYIEEGPAGAANAFRKVAERFPNDVQSAVFAALFGRGGYDETGDPTPDQEAAEKNLLELAQEHPDSQIPLNALLFIRAEAPHLAEDVGLASKLSQMAPNYPPYSHLLGHYEWRSGNHDKAASAFSQASMLYQRWMKDNNATVADCPEWVKAECYRVVALTSKGDFNTAYAAARRVAAIPLPENRPSSPGTRYLLWDAKTLPARLLIHRGFKGNDLEAADSLPKPDDLAPYRQHSLAYWWIDGLRFAIDARRLIYDNQLDEAQDVIDALTHHGELMTKTQRAAAASGERSEWRRAFQALEILAGELRGRLALAGTPDKRGSAFNWFSFAADRQRPAPLLCPPLILTPMHQRLGDYFLATKNPEKAIAAYQKANETFPNNVTTLSKLKTAHEVSGNSADAAAVETKIQQLKATD